MPRYRRQRPEDGSSCYLVALCNARRYYGLRAPLSGSKRFWELREAAGCIAGSCIHRQLLARELGLRRYRIKPESAWRRIPSILSVFSPTVGFHAVLAIGGTPKQLTLVNYRSYRGPTIEVVRWADLDMPPPGNINRRAWSIRLKQ
jgi:hypothetical protein